MENVFVAVIVIFILLFGGLTMSEANITAQKTLMEASQDMNNRTSDIRDTSVSPAALRILNAGSTVDVLVKNTGSAKLTDFNHWNVFADYLDDVATPVYHTNQLTYDSSTTPANNTWAPGTIYTDWENGAVETYEPGILNPGEEIVLHLKLSPPVGVGKTATISVATSNGVTMSTIGMRNALPTLPINTGFKVANHGTALVSKTALLASDTDNTADELTYTVTTPPTQGTLSPATGFTQQQINDGEVTYTHTGSGNDSFTFTLTDGTDVIGPFTTNVTINVPPVRAVNAGLTLNANTTATITSSLLQMTDGDDTDAKLIYTVTQFPANGALSLGSTFTQLDVDSGNLTYTSVGTLSDQFKYMVTDGYDVIGTYTFNIIVQ